VSRIHRKIEDHADEIARSKAFTWRGAGTSSWPTGQRPARPGGRPGTSGQGEDRPGFLRLKTLWPFPDGRIRSMVGRLENVFFAEMNLGYMIHP